MALGPTLPDGRRVLFLVADDNSHAIQDARVLALAIAPSLFRAPWPRWVSTARRGDQPRSSSL
jgi:hypothetical protein